ncbi:MAG: rRNA pseudouridine synthase [bacterium]|nr:rRNA pseudouridine synthase [bacterium]
MSGGIGQGPIRLGKFIATAGAASRRRAVELIKEGKVRVDGRVVTDPALEISPESRVTLEGKPVRRQPYRYYLLHKPLGVISTAADTHGRRTVTELVPRDVRVYPVGRLDADSSGLMVLTNDGELANRLLHPRYGLPKTYRAVVEGSVSEQALEKLRDGVRLRDGRTQPATVRRLGKVPGGTRLELTIREGRNRQVRRMCETVEHPVTRLMRVKFGPLPLGRLKQGQHRTLTSEERKQLQDAAESGGLKPGGSARRR